MTSEGVWGLVPDVSNCTILDRACMHITEQGRDMPTKATPGGYGQKCHVFLARQLEHTLISRNALSYFKPISTDKLCL